MDMDRTACYRAISTRDARFDGRLFVGVKTTGIYCRPICPARTPKFENVSFYPSAAAAQEAGFRPCLRCRPETSPDLAFWRGTTNTVSRALALIEAGGLDESDVEGLANRLGVGARQLRRLLRQHFRALAIAVAQTRRVLLAYLLPYDWDAMLSFLGARAIPGVETVAGDVYRRTIAIGDASGVISVAPADKNRVNVSVRFPNMATLPAIIARVRRVFDLAADPHMIGAHLSLDPMLAPLVSVRPG